jgi:hypothetical protein
MKDDEAHLRLTIDVHYELGRTSPQDLERVLVGAADHLAEEELLTGETEASVLTWNSWVSTPNDHAQLRRNTMNEEIPSKEVIIERVEASLESRHKALCLTPKARRRDEAAFLSGACCALQAVFGNPEKPEKPEDVSGLTDYIPPAWIFAPLCGRLLTDLKKGNGDK